MDEQLGRFQVIKNRENMASPACSFFNRSSDDEWYIWTGTFTEFEGAVYIGEQDFIDLANSVGYIAPERFARLTRAYRKLKEEHEELTTRLAGTASLGNSLRAMLASIEGKPAPTTTGNRQIPDEPHGTDSEFNKLSKAVFEATLGNGTSSPEPTASS